MIIIRPAAVFVYVYLYTCTQIIFLQHSCVCMCMYHVAYDRRGAKRCNDVITSREFNVFRFALSKYIYKLITNIHTRRTRYTYLVTRRLILITIFSIKRRSEFVKFPVNFFFSEFTFFKNGVFAFYLST